MTQQWGFGLYLGRTYGSTKEERLARLPGDDIIVEARVQTDHAVTIDAPPSGVWLRSNSHLPMSWRDRATLDWTWTFVITPRDGGRRCRYHFRSRWVTAPWWFSTAGWLGIVPADFVMARDHLHGIKQRAERLGDGAVERVVR